MRAVLLTAPRRMQLGELPAPTPAPHEVLVRVQAVGLCGTDFHIHSGEANYTADETGAPVPLETRPQVLGHEVTGVVVEVGRDVRDLAPGARVVLDQGLNCRSQQVAEWCEYCLTGVSHQCEHYREHGITGLQGGLAEALCIAAVNAVPIESELPPVHAALTEPLACVLYSTGMLMAAPARYRVAAADPAERARTVLVCGAGPAGCLFVQALRKVAGFDGTLLVSDPNPEKRDRAAALGAEVLDAARDVKAEVRERTGGRLAEVVIDASGSGALFRDLPALVRKQGTVMLYGHGHGGVGMELLNALQFREPTLLSPVGASGPIDPDGRPRVYRRALELIEAGTVAVAPLVTHRFRGLEQVPAAFEAGGRQPGYCKGVVELG